MLIRIEGHARENRGAAAWLRRDGKLAFHQLDPFAHADKSQSPTAKGIVLVKASAVVTNGELNLCWGRFEFHFEVSDTAVLNRILQGFL
jgi:hypothetical protein